MSDIHSLSGAYALDAVDDIERAAFERHLRECESCALEVLELRETVSRLSDSVATEPPPGLRDSVLQAVARTPQAPPGRSERNPAAASAKRWRRFAAASVAAGVIAAGVGVGTWAVGDRKVDDARRATAVAEARASAIEQVMAAPDVRVFSHPAQGGGTVNVAVARSLDSGVAVVSGLPGLGDGKIYQLWMIPAGKPADVARDAGRMAPGATSVAQPVQLGDAKVFGVTVEPEGGSKKPTTTPIVTVSLE
jgi:anti-sigma-K factor RskA